MFCMRGPLRDRWPDLLQVNVRIPADTPSGDIPVEVHVGNAESQPGITVAVQ